jgi:hypothetical protein
LKGYANNYKKDWKLIGSDDFNSQEDIKGWNFVSTSYCGSSSDLFLGGHCLLSNQIVKKTYNDLPKHTRVLVTANVHFIDDWQGETAYVKIDDKVAWMKSVRSGPTSINICGGSYGEAAFNVPVIAEIAHDDFSLNLSFETNIERDPCDVSFGIDNVAVYVK